MPDFGPFRGYEKIVAVRSISQIDWALDIEFRVESFDDVRGRRLGRAFDRVRRPRDSSGMTDQSRREEQW